MTEIGTDVLIIGGGIAGLNGALAAREKGVEVLILDKGGIARSGDIGAGVDHFEAYLEEGEPWDTREGWLKYVKESAYGAVDLKVHDAIFCREIKATIERLAKIGNRLNDPATGRFVRTRAFGMPGPYLINFKGKEFKPNLAKAVRRLGCQVLEKVAVTKIVVKDGRVIGATGFQVRTGEFYAVKAKAVLIGTGNTNRLYENPSGLPFNTWYSPYNTGDGQRLAFEAGAGLANMEYMVMTVVPKGFSAAGMAAFMGMGCHIINARGERFMEKYHPQGERAPRYRVVQGILSELQEGRGPVYVDAQHLSEKEVAHLKATLSWDKDTFPDYLAQKGIDLSKEPLELMASEAMQMGVEVVSGGIRIDERCAASLPGLFAAGDCADQTRAASRSTTGGYVAGREAAQWARGVKGSESLNKEEVEEERERLFGPLKRKDGVTYTEYEDIIRKIMWENVGLKRSEAGLKYASEKLSKLDSIKGELIAGDYHELMRVEESRSLLAAARIMAAASSFRKESRFGLCHTRIDYPETDNQKWAGLITVRKDGDGIELSFSPLDYS